MATKTPAETTTAHQLATRYCDLRQAMAAAASGKPGPAGTLRGGLAFTVNQLLESLADLLGEPPQRRRSENRKCAEQPVAVEADDQDVHPLDVP